MAQTATMTDYNIDQVYRYFSQVIDQSDSNSIRLPEFVNGFRELTKFFNHLNMVFSFVVHDLVDKFTLLGSLYQGDPEHYRTVQSMIEYEKIKNDQTGTIALLRLLRALEFTYLFLQRAIVAPTDSSPPKQVAWDVYKQTLHKRHSKAVRLSIWFATATIPKREVLKKTLTQGELQPQTAEKTFPVIGEIYREIFQLYEKNHFLELVQL